jgi:hypothetical protein
MTWGAIDVETFLAAFKNFPGNGERHDIAWIAADFAGVEIVVFVQLSTGDGAFDNRARGALVGEKVTARNRILTRLHVHIDAAGGGQ